MSIKIIDNQFTQNEIELIHRDCLSIPCTWAAATGKSSWKFWNGYIFSKRTQYDNLSKYTNIKIVHQTIDKILNSLTDKYDLDAVYVNGQSVGNESPLHQDGNDLTIIYYSNPNWKIDWDGGTSFYNSQRDECVASVSYKAGRFVIYNSEIPHKPQSISVLAEDIRMVLVFKFSRIYQ
jgi:hypothetical protein